MDSNTTTYTKTFSIDLERTNYHRNLKLKRRKRLITVVVIWLVIFIYMITPLSRVNLKIIGNVYYSKDELISMGYINENRLWWLFDENKAIIFGYQIAENRANGLVDVFPDRAISIGQKCQGISITNDGNFVLSTSYGLSDSELFYYKDIFNGESINKYRIGLKEIPLYYLDSSNLLSSKKIPAMSEEIVIINDFIYILFESAASQYKLFNRVRLNSVYSVPVDFLKK
jgi:hypothetical protein